MMFDNYSNTDDLSYVDFDSVPFQDSPIPRGWNDVHSKNSWIDGYTARRRVFPDGQMEISVCKGKHFCGPALFGTGGRAARGESENRERNDEDAGRAAKKRVRERCKAIAADRMITLTYRDNLTDRETALKHWDKFRRRMGKFKKFHYVAVIEEQQRGALHFHIAVNGRQCYQLLRSIWSSIVGTDSQGRSMSNIDVRNPSKFGFGKSGMHKLASYIAKYCSKTMSCRSLEKKRYFSSRGIVVPELQTWRLPCKTALDAVRTAFRIASCGCLDGMQFWHNPALNVIWIATCPCSDVGSDGGVPF